MTLRFRSFPYRHFVIGWILAGFLGLFPPSAAWAAETPGEHETIAPVAVDADPDAVASADPEGDPRATVFSVVHKFTSGAFGRHPRGGVAVDAKGVIYGTTLYDGLCTTCGVIYRLVPTTAAATAYRYEVLYRFNLTAQDGIGPTGPLLITRHGIFGTASAGANFSCGCGEVFKLSSSNGGKTWTYRILHRFTPRQLGSTPIAGLVADGTGMMYGTTSAGGRYGAGIVYRIGPSGGYRKLWDLRGNFNGGPQSELVIGKDGWLYGTTFGGGLYNEGTIFRISKSGGGFKTLYNFKGVNRPGNSSDGAQPDGRIAVGPDGTLYGTTAFGGSPSGYGTAWSFKPSGAGGTYRQLYIFGSPGNIPHGGVVLGPFGKLYGPAAGGGGFQSGAIYSLTRPTTGTTWRYTLMHSFKGRSPGGDIPYAGIVIRGRTIFGTNLQGGNLIRCNNGCGTVFKLKF